MGLLSTNALPSPWALQNYIGKYPTLETIEMGKVTQYLDTFFATV